EEKRKTIKLAHQTSNTNATKHYSLDLAILSHWVKKFFQDLFFSFSQRNSLKIGSERHVFFSEKETKLYE
ncbi:21530_t:CDS:1, partial [Gigaspora margarita]